MSATVCLLSPAPLWVNPRLRKEADALFAAGYDVVVGYRADGDTTRDDDLLSQKPWRWHRVDVGRRRGRARWARAAARQRGAELAVRVGVAGARRAAYCRADDALYEWAVSQRAALYIAHTQPVLAVAADAARCTGAAFAFDCEDLLAEEAADGGRAPWRRRMIASLEREYLPRAAYVSAVSVPMAAYLRDSYELQRVAVWHNCFPAAETRDVLPPSARARSGTTELTWLSATIGPGRGLEDVFTAMTRLPQTVRLHLYGYLPGDYAAWFQTHAGGLARQGRVVVGPLPAAEQVMATLARHHVGLTVDQNDCVNRSLTVCNKLFLYLQAGLACVATDTAGHRSVLGNDAQCGAVYAPGDVGALVAVLDRLRDPSVCLEAQQAAWELGQQKYVWDAERPLFLEAVAGALRPSAPHQEMR